MIYVFKKTILAAKRRIDFMAGQHKRRQRYWQEAEEIYVQDAGDLNHSHSIGDKSKWLQYILQVEGNWGITDYN